MSADNAARADAAFRQAYALHQQERLAEAQSLYRQALQFQPLHFQALHSLGVIALQQNKPEQAIELLRSALTLAPQSPAAHLNHGTAQHQLGQFEDALVSFDRAIALRPDLAEGYFNRGNSLRELRRHEAAVASYDRAVNLKPNYASGFLNRALALSDLGQHAAALASYEEAIALDPHSAEAHFNRGNLLRQLKRYETAVASYDRAIACQAGYAEAHLNRGSALFELRQYIPAIASYNKAIALKPDFAGAYLNRGSALRQLGQYAAALANYDTALGYAPDDAAAHRHRGNVLRDLKQFEAAIASYDKAIALPSDLTDLRANRLRTMMEICDWRGWRVETEALASGIQSGATDSNPFFVLAFSDSAALQKRAAENWVFTHYPPDPALPAPRKRTTPGRLHIGYFSGDFRSHPLAYLTAGVFEAHERSSIEATAFSYGPDTQDDSRKRLESAFDRFLDMRDRSAAEVAQLARSLGVDIAVDLGGFTQEARPGVLAMRAAPLQVSFLGYPGTLGAPYIDYLIADRVVVPESSQPHYAEKIIYFPQSYWPNSYRIDDPELRIADAALGREQLGLPQTGFVFCCFNNSYKITPPVFDGWMRILERVSGSVLWLLQDNPDAANHLRREALRRGVAAERLVFAQRVPRAEHLARHCQADLFLDTFPCNAHTTASDALWAGVPVLTCAGEAFAARVAASLLTALGLPELIAFTPLQYETLAVSLATEPGRLAGVKRQLEERRPTSALFDTRLYVKHLEAAYREIHERFQADLPARHVYL